VRLGAFRLGLHLRHSWCGYSGTPRHVSDRFVPYPPQEIDRTTIRLHVAAVEHRIVRKQICFCNFCKQLIRVRAGGFALRAGNICTALATETARNTLIL
jgi:hypothetical protein